MVSRARLYTFHCNFSHSFHHETRQLLRWRLPSRSRHRDRKSSVSVNVVVSVLHFFFLLSEMITFGSSGSGSISRVGLLPDTNTQFTRRSFLVHDYNEFRTSDKQLKSLKRAARLVSGFNRIFIQKHTTTWLWQRQWQQNTEPLGEISILAKLSYWLCSSVKL